MPEQTDLPWESAFIRRMKAIRERDDISQTELARAAAEKGLAFHQQTIQRIENGSRPVRLNEAIILAELLGSNLDAMTETDTPDSTRSEMSYAATKLVNVLREFDAAVTEQRRELHVAVGSMELALAAYLRTCREQGVKPRPIDVMFSERQIAVGNKAAAIIEASEAAWKGLNEEFLNSHPLFMSKARALRDSKNA